MHGFSHCQDFGQHFLHIILQYCFCIFSESLLYLSSRLPGVKLWSLLLLFQKILLSESTFNYIRLFVCFNISLRIRKYVSPKSRCKLFFVLGGFFP